MSLESSASAAAPAELIVINAKVRTLDPERPLVAALAVQQGRILAVGTTEEIRLLAAADTQTIDAGGRLVLPGFNDAHVHFVSGGRQLSNVDLRDARSMDEFRERIKRFVATQAAGTWITGGDWDHENWEGAPLPTRAEIDDFTSEHPVFIRRLDGHMGLANSLALSLGNVNRETADPPGGLIVRDQQGEPTGVLKDAAMALVTSHIPPLTPQQRRAAAKAATEHAARLGVTSVQDMSGSDDVGAYQELLDAGELKTRIYVAAPLPQWERSAAKGLRAAAGSVWLRQGALKGYSDGSLGSSTAWFFDAYQDAPDQRGLPSDEMLTASEMLQRVQAADAAGLQIMIHAIGDRANAEVLRIYEQVQAEQPSRDRRFRIEHAQHLRFEEIPRFAELGVVASMQPVHCADDGRWAEKRIGLERARGSYAFRSLLDEGCILAFGTDWNVAPLEPMLGIAAAVTRRTWDDKHPDGWIAEQKITVDEAVSAYTRGSAYAEFQDHEKGMLRPGMLADFVVWSNDIFTIPDEEIGQVYALVTVVHGREVFRHAGFE